MQTELNKEVKNRGSACFTLLLIVCVLTVCTKIFAYEGFRCIPSVRETRLQVLVKDNVIQALVTNPMGYDFMPQFEGPSSKFNVSFNKMQANDLEDLSDSFHIEWPKENCKVDSNKFTLNCTSASVISISTMRSYGVTTTEVLEKYDNDIYDKRKFRFSLEKDNLYFVSLQFDIKTCEKF